MIKNIKLTVKTDEQNQYVLNKLIDINKEFAWDVDLDGGFDYCGLQASDNYRAACSVWKGFRHLVIDEDGDLIFYVFDRHYNETNEKEITFEEFKDMVDPKVIEVNGVKYKRLEEENETK